MSTEKMQKVRIIFDRVKKTKGFDKDTELAEYLGITKQTLAAWESRGRIANVKVFTDKGCSADWVRTGEGSVYPSSGLIGTAGLTERGDDVVRFLKRKCAGATVAQYDVLLEELIKVWPKFEEKMEEVLEEEKEP